MESNILCDLAFAAMVALMKAVLLASAFEVARGNRGDLALACGVNGGGVFVSEVCASSRSTKKDVGGGGVGSGEQRRR